MAVIGLVSLNSKPARAMETTQTVAVANRVLDTPEGATPEPDERSPGTISSTAVPTTTPTPWPTPEVDVRDRLDLDSPDYVDRFDNARGWYTYDTAGTSAYSIQKGKLTAHDYEPEERYTWWSWLGRQSGNLYAEVTAINGDCIGKDSIGMAIRVDEQSGTGGYALELSCDGYWRLRLHRNDSSPREITGWSSSQAINPGPFAENRLGLFAYRNQFYIYINDVPVSVVSDPPYSRSFGNFALYVRSSMTYDLEAEFDDFAFWHVKYVP
jgi:hypothetical protein